MAISSIHSAGLRDNISNVVIVLRKEWEWEWVCLPYSSVRNVKLDCHEENSSCNERADYVREILSVIVNSN